MAKTNTKKSTKAVSNDILVIPVTHEGAPAAIITPEQQLRRSVCSCMLFEDEFYEDGQAISDRIKSLIGQIDPDWVAILAIEARQKFKLRHIPLFIACELAHKKYSKTTLLISRIIQRPDEIAEFLSLYWKDGHCPVSTQVKEGLAAAFLKFDEYQFAKYSRHDEGDKIKLRDVISICHPKPANKDQARLFRKIRGMYCTCGHTHYNLETKTRHDECLDPDCKCYSFNLDTLSAPNTWESALVSGKDKKETFTQLLQDNKLGALALLRNLRGMKEAGVDNELVKTALSKMKTERILPFRFIPAAKYAPHLEPEIEQAMLKCLAGQDKLPGKTKLIIDGSGSMFGTPVSKKSDIDRFEAAAALAILIRELCDDLEVIIFSNTAQIVPSRHGFALRDALYAHAEKCSTDVFIAMDMANKSEYNRVIIITDEQSYTPLLSPLQGAKSYIINVASNKYGIGYGKWNHIDGWSEHVIDFIQEYERLS